MNLSDCSDWGGLDHSTFFYGIWVICPAHRLLSPSLQVEPPRDLYKVSQPGIGSAQNCHPQPPLCRSNACEKKVPGSWRNSRG